MVLNSLPSTRITHDRSRRPVGAVAIVASAGGIHAVRTLLDQLPANFALPIFVAQHVARGPSVLPTLLSWRSRLTISWATNDDRPQRGHVYLAPPGMRLDMNEAGLIVSPLAPQSRSWLASADDLINSVARLYGARTIAIVLSGSMMAGIEGVQAVNARGGVTMAQNPTTACDFAMPCAAIDLGKAEIVLPPARMAKAIQVVADHWERESQ